MFQDRRKDGEKKQHDHKPTEMSSADKKRHESVRRKPDNQYLGGIVLESAIGQPQ